MSKYIRPPADRQCMGFASCLPSELEHEIKLVKENHLTISNVPRPQPLSAPWWFVTCRPLELQKLQKNKLVFVSTFHTTYPMLTAACILPILLHACLVNLCPYFQHRWLLGYIFLFLNYQSWVLNSFILNEHMRDVKRISSIDFGLVLTGRGLNGPN